MFIIITFTVYTLIGYIPGFMIKLAPPLDMPPFNAKIYYFVENFKKIWHLKLIVALIVALLLTVILSPYIKKKTKLISRERYP
jgi:hypothetical protein